MTAAEGDLIEFGTFEALFVFATQPTGVFRQQLARVGFDLDNLKPLYPTQVWCDSVEVARQYLFSNLPVADGARSVGRMVGEHYFSTLVGKLIAVTLPLVGVERVVRRIPRYFAASSRGSEVDVEEEAPKRWRVNVRTRYGMPEFVRGSMEAAFPRTGQNVRVDVASESAEGFQLLITW